MDGKLYELFVKLFEGWLAEWREGWLDGVMDVVVANTQGWIFFFDASQIDNISMIHFFENIGSID